MTRLAMGLIGGIASGKSLASQYFKDLGVDVIDSDQIAHEIVKPGTPILNDIVNHFGLSVLNEQGELNRAHLKALIFKDPSERLWLESLMHPVIREKIDAAIDAAKSPYCVVAIPLLKRREDYPKLSKILFLDIPIALQIKRLIDRDHVTEDMAKKIIASQPSRGERLALADIVIVNDGSVRDLLKKIQACKMSKIFNA